MCIRDSCIDQLRHMIPLGRDAFSDEKISYTMVDEMCRVLKNFAEIMNSYHVDDYRAYATSAMREAKNNQIILDQIKVCLLYTSLWQSFPKNF